MHVPAGEAGSDFLQLERSQVPGRGIADWLVSEIRRAVQEGRLAPGTGMPATRTLAADLAVSRGVVVESYQRLSDEGLLRGRTGSGTVVAASAPEPTGTATTVDTSTRLPRPTGARPAGIEFDLTPGIPDLSAFPRTAWLRHERAVLSEVVSGDLGYGDPRGHPVLRTELASWLARTRGVRVAPDGVLVVSGVAQALALLAQTMRSRSTHEIGVEDPGSRGAREELAHWGVSARPVPVDEEGAVIAELVRTDLSAVLLTPAHQFPTGVVLSARRRRELLHWVAGGGLVIEDDYDAEHRYDRAPVAALQAAAPHGVVHAGSTSKTLAPGMRLGWMVAPADRFDELVAAKHASDLGSPALPQLVLARLLGSGDYDRHLRRVRVRQRRRRDALLAALRRHVPDAHVGGVAAGLHLLVTLPDAGPHADDVALADRIREAGVLVHPLSWHRMTPGPGGLVLGYAAQSPDRLEQAVHRLATVVR